MAGPKSQLLLLLCLALGPIVSQAWFTSSVQQVGPRVQQPMIVMFSSSDSSWNGEVVANTPDGSIKGCSITPVGLSEPYLEWMISIDGVEADLGRFSEAIYKRVTAAAKKERFQGFRPGTIPPHLEPTYRAFTMDECARETIMEAMQQNNIKPFENARSEFVLESFHIPPPTIKTAKKKRKKSEDLNEDASTSEEPKWRTFETMKEAIDAGWRPGQSFSFVAKKVKGQKVKSNSDVQGASPIGLRY